MAIKRIVFFLIAVIIVGLIAGLVTYHPPEMPKQNLSGGQLKLHFIDVGQGDCILLEAPDGRNILVDTGEESYASDVIRYLSNEDIKHLDLFVITHPHADHIGGASQILDNFGVSKVVDTGFPHGSKAYRDLLSKIESKKIDYAIASEGTELHVSKDVAIEVLWPPADYINTESDINNSSIVLHVQYKDVGILLTGDIEKEAEGRLLASHKDLRSDILKVAHHGSENSTSNEFLQVVQPEYAVISVGADNQYGHPDDGTIRRLRAKGATVLRTDRLGTIVFTTDGHNIQVDTER